MRPGIGIIRSLAVFAILLGIPVSTLARGSGGHGGGGGHAGGSGHFGGARGFHGAGPGFRGYGPGYRGYGAGYPGFVGRYRGYGWGYPGYYGWGYPYYGTGLGLGLGLGLGYGLSSGYGYGGYGYPSYSYGYNYGNGGYASGTYYGGTAVPTSSTTPSASNVVPVSSATTDNAKTATSAEFAERGTAAFKSANYEQAVYAWRHAIVDDPQNPELVLMLGQALFAIGKYEESAGAIQAAMRQLPKEAWGNVVRRFRDFYGDPREYTRQLRDLEKSVGGKPDNPALRFLAGYHYGYLGFLKQSIEQLDKGIQIESRDEMAKQLRDEMKNRLGQSDSPPTESSSSAVPAPATATSWTKSR